MIQHIKRLLAVLWLVTVPLTLQAADEEIPLGELESTKNFEQWLEEAREGSAIAQYMMGRHYESGKGVRKDFTKAAQWYAKSAKQGMSDADAILGLLFLNGKGVPQNSRRGIALLKKSAQRGNIRARYHLGLAYLAGKHVRKDVVTAYMWLYLAAYLPRTPESFLAKEKMHSIGKVLSQKEVNAALKKAEKYK